jgi:long-chain acyl-CoA synthetase
MYALKEMTLVELVEKGSKHYGDRAALSMFGGASLSYAGLEKASAAFAQKLLSYGIEDGDKVALLSENSPAWGVAFFAILRAGAIAVPILVDFNPDQIANILKHSGARAVICSDKLEAKLKPSYGSLAIVGIVEGELRRKGPTREKAQDKIRGGVASKVPGKASKPTENDLRSPRRPGKDDLAMIIYTSGTTGSSKGVMLSHRNVLSNALACRSIIILHRIDQVLSILPLAHTYEFTIGFIIPLLAGSHIHYLDRPPSATVLLPALKAIRPTIMLSVPLVIEKIYRSSIKPTLEGMKLYSNKFIKPLLIRFAGIKLKKTFGGRIRFFGVGGAPLAAEVESFLKKAKFPYAIGYGLTECAPLLAGCSPSRTFIRSTGPALKGVQLRIADPNPSTGEGEIQARGDNIFKGYYLDQEKTAEAFTAGLCAWTDKDNDTRRLRREYLSRRNRSRLEPVALCHGIPRRGRGYRSDRLRLLEKRGIGKPRREDPGWPGRGGRTLLKAWNRHRQRGEERRQQPRTCLRGCREKNFPTVGRYSQGNEYEAFFVFEDPQHKAAGTTLRKNPHPEDKTISLFQAGPGRQEELNPGRAMAAVGIKRGCPCAGQPLRFTR